MEMDSDDDEQFYNPFDDFMVTVQVPVAYLRLVNRRLGAEYLCRVYSIFIFQLLLSGAYVLYPTVWWSAIHLSIIISPLVVNVWNYSGLRHCYPFTLAGLLFAEFVYLEYIVFTQNIGTILLGLTITFALCTLLYIYLCITEKVIVLGLPPTNLIILLLIIFIIAIFKKQEVLNMCSYFKNFLAVYYVLTGSYIIEPMGEYEYIHAGTKLHLNFLFTLAFVFTILNL